MQTTTSLAQQIDTTAANTQQPDSASAESPLTATDTLKSSDTSRLVALDTSEVIRFLKKQIVHGPDSLLFNIVKVKNPGDEPINGMFSINLPDGWSLSGFSTGEQKLSLQPGEERVFPVFIKIDKGVTGGQTYIVSAKFLDDETQKGELASSFVNVPKVSNWDLEIPQPKVYFDVSSKYARAQIRLENNGNAEELINLRFEAEKNIRVRGMEYPEDEIYIELKPKHDTTIEVLVSYVATEEDQHYSQTRHGKNLHIKAINGGTQAGNIYFAKLPSFYKNILRNSQTPLNIQFFAQNLLAQSVPYYQGSVYGDLMFCNDNQLSYRLNIQRLNYGNRPRGLTYGEQLYQYSYIRISWITDRYRVTLGDITGGFDLPVVGRGAEVEAKLGKRTRLSANAGANVRFPINGYAAQVNSQLLKRFGVGAGFTYVDDEFNQINRYNGGASVSWSFLKHNSVSLKVALSQREHYYSIGDFNGLEESPNTTFQGYSTRLNYAFKLPKLGFNLSGFYNSPDHAGRINNHTQVSADAYYNLTKRTTFRLNTDYLNTNPRLFYQGRTLPIQPMEQEYYSFQAQNRFTSKLNASLAGTYINTTVFTSYPALNELYPNETNNYNLSGRLGYKLDSRSSLSATLVKGFYQIVDFYEDAPTFQNAFDPDATYPNTRLNLNYRRNQSGVAFTYVSGILSPSQISLIPAFGENQSIQVSPYFNKSYLDDRLIIRSYNTFIFQTATSTESFNLNVSPRLNLDKGWTIDVNASYRILSRENNEQGRYTTRSFFVSAGITKSFEFQQPCIKYYDLKLVYFKDLNGNHIRDENEPFLSDMIATIQRDKDQGEMPEGDFIELDLISDQKGTITYKNIPEGPYKVTSFSVKNLGDIYSLNGASQKVDVMGNTTVYMPYAESYKIKGKVVVLRDKFSSLGEISLDGIGIQARDKNGEVHKTLTDRNGHFTLFVPPKKGLYEVSINNIFGQDLRLEQNKYIVEFSGFRTFEVNFTYRERKRGINVEGGGYEFDLLKGQEAPPGPKEKADTKKTPEEKPLPGEESETGEPGTPTPKAPASTELEPGNEDLKEEIDDLRQQLDELRKAQEEMLKKKPDTVFIERPPEERQGQGTQTGQDDALKDYKELENLVDELIDRTNPNINFRVEMGVYKDQMPVNQLNQLIKLGSVESGETEGGASRFVSKPFSTVEDARRYADELRKMGYEKVRVFAEENGKEIPLEEGQQRLNNN